MCSFFLKFHNRVSIQLLKCQISGKKQNSKFDWSGGFLPSMSSDLQPTGCLLWVWVGWEEGMANHCLPYLPVTLVSETEFKFHIELEQEGKDISFLVDNALEIWKPCTLDLTDVDNWLILNNGTLLYMSEEWSTARGPVVTLRSPWWNASGVL